VGPEPHQPVNLQGLQGPDGLTYAPHPSAENRDWGSLIKTYMKFSALFQILIRMDLDQEAMKQAK
jgi:hypothetical protein